MPTIQIEFPESILLTTGQAREEFILDAKYFVALKLFELGRLSSGLAAEICQMSRVEFLLRAGRSGVPIVDLDEDDLDREFEEI